MKRLLNRLISLILALILGFWLSYHDVLQDTWVGDQLITISELVPAPEDWPINDGPETSVVPPSTIEETEPLSEKEMFEVEMEQLIFEKINRLRLDEDLNTLTYHPILEKAARKRAMETSVSFSHTRPNGTDTFTVLEENGTVYPYVFAGENLAMAPIRSDAEGMSNILFEGWLESPSHYATMIKPTFRDLGVGVYTTDGIVYAAQMLGTHYHY